MILIKKIMRSLVIRPDYEVISDEELEKNLRKGKV